VAPAHHLLHLPALSKSTRTAKKRGNELSGAIRDFDEAVKNVRSFVGDAVQSLSDNAAKLSRLAGRASEESSVATEAALNTAENASTIAAAVEQLNSSLGNISGQAVDGAQVGEQAVARAIHTMRQSDRCPTPRKRSALSST